ncbi:MAG TPA: 4Fe-4S ferredoxin [Treponema sp.]|nr:4Fe-4S ferredoxin [Treponema sp.]
MLSLPESKINDFFAQIGAKENLYIPVDNTSGKANFEKWESGKTLSKALKTVRSAKDFFFPKAENLVNLKLEGKHVTVEDPRKELEDFVVFGVRACDAKSFDIVDAVYLNMTPVDSYYKNRRDHGTVITLACTEPAQTCFCSAYKIDAANPAGDVSAWLCDGTYYFKANTPKGEKLLKDVASSLSEKDDAAVSKQQEETRKKCDALPFAKLDLSKWQGKDMLKIFNSKIWDDLSATCLGCGTCTYVCPTCMCFDIRDFDTGKGVKQFRCWDSCMYSDFTQMAAANPRLSQKERFRQRFMHKLVYYPMAHEDNWQCVGCGRCLESCPIHMNIVKVVKAYNESESDGGNK